MAAVLISTVTRYIGTSAERTAMVTTDLRAGAEFEETDTGNTYKWDGAAWYTAGMEIFGATLEQRPDADTVKVGMAFILVVDPIVVYMSDGTNWVEVS